jgi:hypothetical protein
MVKLMTVVLLAEIGTLCWYGGYVSGNHSALQSALASQVARVSMYQAEQERDRAAAVRQRLRIVGVDSVRFVNPLLPDDAWAQVEFKLTNRTGKVINELYGSIRLYDVNHNLLGTVAANVVEPLGVGETVTGVTRWSLMDPASRSALASGKITADYRADRVFFSDGATQRFNVEQLFPDSDFMPAQ